ncbi:MAG: hypothetical protein A2X12_09185 [Bacteroidetes bacterium GWE2_29_8]|nr:MAG: hypothetical protein A2X12_09185 [Bacteroidetes bacterium GWE2_29_8]OFY20549.1 MAG: hypothetical protein A2X02_06245 [Bacteroidetes bacterium GWF2_29_10]
MSKTERLNIKTPNKKENVKPLLTSKKVDFPNWGIIQNKPFYFVIFLFIVAFILRVYNAGYLALWLDEYMHASPSVSFLNGGSMLQDDNNGLFLTIMTIGFFKLFGVSEFVARMPSIIFGSLSIVLTFLLAKRLYNSKIGFLAALLNALSLYTIFWSRIARNYACFEFSFLLLAIVFLLSFEHMPNIGSEPNNFWNKNKINKKWIFILPLVFIYSLFNHMLTVFVLFSLCFYVSVIAIKKIIRRENGAWLNKYSLIFYPSLIFGILFFSPYLETVASPILLKILPERSLGFFIPDWGYIIGKLKDIERFKSFNIYYDVLSNDYKYLHFIGILGILFAFIENKKSGLFLFSMFVIPFLIMSFIYREPYLPHYLLYIYPFFLIYIAVGVYSLIKYSLSTLFKNKVFQKSSFSSLHLILSLLLILIFTPFKEIKSLITNKSYGQIVKKELFNSTFVNWKEPCLMLKPYLQKDDLVIATWYQAPNFYLGIENTVRFRQRHLDTKERRYVDNTPQNTNQNSAASYEDFVRTFQANKKGWFLADYYFHNVFTDPRARDFAIKNMTYHFNFCPSSEIMVFSWDRTKPKTQPDNTLLIEVGKDKSRPLSEELTFNVNNYQNSSVVQLFIDAEGIDNNDEAVIVINGEHTQFITKKDVNTGVIEINQSQRRVFTETLNKSWFKETGNTLQFGYNNQTHDIKSGFVVYNIAIQAN